jgi:hypothetical protein
MSQTADVTSRSTIVPKVVALVGLLAMLVLKGFELQALTWESGDRVLHLNYIEIAIGVITTAAAIIWTIWSRRKAGAIVVLVLSILFNPIWLLLLIRAFG